MASQTPLKRAIQSSGLKQSFIARELGVSEFTMSRIVHGLRPINAHERKALARALRRKVHDLFPEEATA